MFNHSYVSVLLFCISLKGAKDFFLFEIKFILSEYFLLYKRT